MSGSPVVDTLVMAIFSLPRLVKVFLFGRTGLYVHLHYSASIDNRWKSPALVLPSKVKRFVMGASRPPSVFSASWPSSPPMIAQTGINSIEAVKANCLNDIPYQLFHPLCSNNRPTAEGLVVAISDPVHAWARLHWLLTAELRHDPPRLVGLPNCEIDIPIRLIRTISILPYL